MTQVAKCQFNLPCTLKGGKSVASCSAVPVTYFNRVMKYWLIHWSLVMPSGVIDLGSSLNQMIASYQAIIWHDADIFANFGEIWIKIE